MSAGDGFWNASRENGNIGYGFLTGSCQREGTVATTFFHDHHNLFVAGNDPKDMLCAVQRIEELQAVSYSKEGRFSRNLHYLSVEFFRRHPLKQQEAR